MSHQQLLTKLEGFRYRNSTNHCYINKDVYRMLYDRDFYYIAYKNAKGVVKTIRIALFRSFKRDKEFFARWLTKIKKPIEYIYKDNNPLQRNCYICGTPHFHAMFHRKKISLIKPPYTHIVKEMVRINRRQICLCKECFNKADNNLFEFNQITKRKLT